MSQSVTTQLSTTRTLPRSGLALLAVGCISLAAFKPQPALAAMAALVGLIFFVWSIRGDLSLVAGDGRAHIWGALAALAVIALSAGRHVGPLPETMVQLRPVWLPLLIASSAIAALAGRNPAMKRLSIGLGLLGLVIATASFVGSEWNSDRGTDVYHAHKAAGAALVSGENPYTDAVTIVNASPYAEEGAVIVGYPYPPVVLFTFGLAGAFTDPRLVTTVAWLAVVGWLALVSLRDDDRSDVAFGAFLLLAAAPVWPVMWIAAWTEPLSVVLFLAAAVLWKRGALKSGIALGLAVASKQYFVFLLPLLLFHREDRHPKRAAIAVSVAALTMLPFLIIDPNAFVTATISNPSRIGFRPDTQSISGLLNDLGVGFEVPVWIWFVLGLGVAYWLSRRSTTVSGFIGRAGLAMGVIFITGLAFPNYWFLVFSLLALGTALHEPAPRETSTRNAA